MITLDLDLPETAMIGGATADLAAAMAACGATWLHGDRRHFECDGADGPITAWHGMDGAQRAVPTQPNEGQGRAMATPTGHGLACRAGVHCGMVVPRLTDRVDRFSMAILYRAPDGDAARTLLTVNGDGQGGGDPYLFLSDNGDTLHVKDTAGALSLEGPKVSQGGGLRCVIVTLAPDRIAMQDGDGPVVHQERPAPVLPVPASLFIGARSHRPGLKKTLGTSVIEDVMFWPGAGLLMPRTPQDAALRLTLARYFLWQR